MEAAATPATLFEQALEALELHLSRQRWDEAAVAGEHLAALSESYRSQGVVLPVETLERARAMYQRCGAMAQAWSQSLNQKAQSAGSSSRAFHVYSQMDAETQPRGDVPLIGAGLEGVE